MKKRRSSTATCINCDEVVLSHSDMKYYNVFTVKVAIESDQAQH
jgi:hypothetical protein